MKDTRQHSAHHKHPTEQQNAARETALACPDRNALHVGSLLRDHEIPGRENCTAISPAVPLLLPESSSRRGGAQQDRQIVEDKIRQTIDSWTAEEQSTAYWYLYACGMTLDRAKAIRHKSGPKT